MIYLLVILPAFYICYLLLRPKRLRLFLSDRDKDYLLIKTAIAKSKTISHLICMQQMIRDYEVVHGFNQQSVYLQGELMEKGKEVLYYNN